MKDLNSVIDLAWEHDASSTPRTKHLADYEFDARLMEYADRPELPNYFKFSRCRKKRGDKATIRTPYTIPEYLDDNGKRLYRTDLTVSPKVRQMLFEAVGGKNWNDTNLAPALIALACYGAECLKTGQYDIEADIPIDPDPEAWARRRAFISKMRAKRRQRMRLK